MKVSIELLDVNYKCVIYNKTSETILSMIEQGKMLEVQFGNDTIYLNSQYITSIKFD